MYVSDTFFIKCKNHKEKRMYKLIELVNNAMHSSPQGFVGVSLIGIYFVIIVGVAFYRIKKADHMHH